jgi:hypothetical protein
MKFRWLVDAYPEISHLFIHVMKHALASLYENGSQNRVIHLMFSPALTGVLLELFLLLCANLC